MPDPRIRIATVIGVAATAALSSACGSPGTGANRPTTVTRSAPTAPAAFSQPQTTAQCLITWNSGPGGRALHALGVQLGSVAKAARSGNLAAFGRACARLGVVVAEAQAAPPVPDAEAQRFYGMALSEYETGAADCQVGASASDVSMMNQATAHITIGSNDLSEATARIQAIARQAG